MSEWALVWIVPIRLGIVLIFSLLYIIGGRRWKAVRRFGGGLFLGGSLILLALLLGTFKWWLAFAPVAYVATLCLGYGGESFWVKFFRRFLYGLAFGACAVLVASTTGAWALAGFQVMMCLSASVYLGLINPTTAVGEEAIIAGMSVFTVPFMI